MTCQTGTIREIHQRLLSEGHKIHQNTLRSWIKQGVLPAAYSGRTAYITYDNVLGIIMNGTLHPSAEASVGEIRRIS